MRGEDLVVCRHLDVALEAEARRDSGLERGQRVLRGAVPLARMHDQPLLQRILCAPAQRGPTAPEIGNLQPQQPRDRRRDIADRHRFAEDETVQTRRTHEERNLIALQRRIAVHLVVPAVICEQYDRRILRFLRHHMIDDAPDELVHLRAGVRVFGRIVARGMSRVVEHVVGDERKARIVLLQELDELVGVLRFALEVRRVELREVGRLGIVVPADAVPVVERTGVRVRLLFPYLGEDAGVHPLRGGDGWRHSRLWRVVPHAVQVGRSAVEGGRPVDAGRRRERAARNRERSLVAQLAQVRHPVPGDVPDSHAVHADQHDVVNAASARLPLIRRRGKRDRKHGCAAARHDQQLLHLFSSSTVVYSCARLFTRPAERGSTGDRR